MKTLKGVIIGIVITVIGGLIVQAVYDQYFTDSPRIVAVVDGNRFEYPDKTENASVQQFVQINIENSGNRKATNVRLSLNRDFETGKLEYPTTSNQLEKTKLISIGDMGPSERVTAKLWLNPRSEIDTYKDLDLRLYSDEGIGEMKFYFKVLDADKANKVWRVFNYILSALIIAIIYLSVWFSKKIKAVSKGYEDKIKESTRRIENVTRVIDELTKKIGKQE